MYYNYTDEELRAYCRNSIESLEMWARRFIHEKMVEKYGEQYINYQASDGNYIIKREIREQVQYLSQKEPQRILRPVDALFLDHLIYFLCKRELYKELFKDALDPMYPDGREEVCTFLERLVPTRNALSHSNPISMRQAEQAVCYSHDFVDSIKSYYRKRGLEQMWNVPRIIRITDSLGNSFENNIDNSTQGSSFRIKQKMYCGDTYSVTIETDSSFSQSEFDILWFNNGKEIKGNKNYFQYTIAWAEEDVEEIHLIRCKIISHKKWHKYGSFDCEVILIMTILPPVE